MALAEPTAETWGQALERHVGRRLNAIVKELRKHDPFVGSRNTFAKLYACTEAPTDPRDRARAVMLLLTVGQNPESWGLSRNDLPPAFEDVNFGSFGWLSVHPTLFCAAAG